MPVLLKQSQKKKEATDHLDYDQYNRAADQRDAAFRTMLALADPGSRMVFFKLKILLPL